MIIPNAPLPLNMRACQTVREPEPELTFSSGDYQGLNLGAHVGDDAAQVERNRAWLQQTLKLPQEPLWLQQVHGNRVVNLQFCADNPEADGAVAHGCGVLAILTADCLPVLFWDVKGRSIGAAHAGWRGLLNGVLENTIAAMDQRPHEIVAWLGAAIGAQSFEVGEEVRAAFMQIQPAAVTAFAPIGDHKYLADIYALARLRLATAGIRWIYGGEYCSYQDPRFYSYRRACHQNVQATGRMASLIWFR